MKYQTHSPYTSTSTAWLSIPTSTSTQCSVASASLYLFSLSAKAYGYATEKMPPAKTIEREKERREPKVHSKLKTGVESSRRPRLDT